MTELREMRRHGFRCCLLVPAESELARNGRKEGFTVCPAEFSSKFHLPSWRKLVRAMDDIDENQVHPRFVEVERMIRLKQSGGAVSDRQIQQVDEELDAHRRDGQARFPDHELHPVAHGNRRALFGGQPVLQKFTHDIQLRTLIQQPSGAARTLLTIARTNPKALLASCFASFIDGLCRIIPAALIFDEGWQATPRQHNPGPAGSRQPP